jgi:hypothetical protein
MLPADQGTGLCHGHAMGENGREEVGWVCVSLTTQTGEP